MSEKCVDCDDDVTNQKTVDFSMRKFGKIKCWNCQQGAKPAEAKPAIQQEFGNGMFNEIQIQMIHKDTMVMLAHAQLNPLGMEFEDIYNKTFNGIMKVFRKKLMEMSNQR